MTLHYRLAYLALLAMARVLWGYRRTGADEIPMDGPAIIACNHVSNWDPILVGLGCPREIHFMAKEELFRNRLLGWLVRAHNAIPVRRGVMDRKVLREATRLLRDGNVLLMFPGGRRDASGEVRDPKAGVGFIAGMSGAPVIPAYLSGANQLSSAFRRKTKLEVVFGPALTIGENSSSEEYREFSKRVADAIGKLRQEVESS